MNSRTILLAVILVFSVFLSSMASANSDYGVVTIRPPLQGLRDTFAPVWQVATETGDSVIVWFKDLGNFLFGTNETTEWKVRAETRDVYKGSVGYVFVGQCPGQRTLQVKICELYERSNVWVRTQVNTGVVQESAANAPALYKKVVDKDFAFGGGLNNCSRLRDELRQSMVTEADCR